MKAHWATSFEITLLLLHDQFRWTHWPLAYVRTRSRIRHANGRPWHARSAWVRSVRMTRMRETLAYGVHVPVSW